MHAGDIASKAFANMQLPTAEEAARLLAQIEAEGKREGIEREKQRQLEAMAKGAGEKVEAIDASGAVGIPLRFQNRSVADLVACDHAGHQRAIDVAKRYVSNWPDVRRNCRSLIFWGDVGTTKTVIATAVLQDVARLGARTMYTTINALVLRIKEVWRESEKLRHGLSQASRGSAGERETAALDAFAMPDLLVIDEIGRTKATDTELLLLAQLIDRRHAEMKPTIVISNLDPDGITARVGVAGMSRLRQGGMCMHFNWPDQRSVERAPC